MVVIVIDVPPETPHQQPVPARGGTSHAITVTCSRHGSAGFTNLMVSTRGDAIVLGPHVDWAMRTLTPSPQSFLDHLAATVKRLSATRSVLRQVIALADDSATLSNKQPQDRLTTLTQACARVWVLTPASEGG
jgi:hypothetical protein